VTEKPMWQTRLKLNSSEKGWLSLCNSVLLFRPNGKGQTTSPGLSVSRQNKITDVFPDKIAGNMSDKCTFYRSQLLKIYIPNDRT